MTIEFGNNSNQHRESHRIKRIILPVGSIVGLVLLGFFSPRFSSAIAINDSISTDIGGLLGILAFISFALESALEIYVSTLRNAGRERLEQQIERVPLEKEESQPGDGEIAQLNLELFEYREDTAYITRVVSLVAGVLIGIMGVRILQPFVNLGTLAGFQVPLFHAVDILLTAALLSGGSEGIHQLTKIYAKATQKAVE